MEKRTSKRIPISLEALLMRGEKTIKAFITDISRNGLYVIMAGEEGLGQHGEKTLTVTVHVPSRGALQLRCRAVRAGVSRLSSREMGLEIEHPPDEFREFYKASYYKIKTMISHEAIAVVGMACHYPGAPDLKSFWENILARRREFRRIPDQRLPLSEYYDPDPLATDKTYGSRAAVIDGFRFDWVKRGIPKTVVESSDVVHWLALEVAVRALEDAGYRRDSVPRDRSGVILGNTLTGEHSRTQNMRLRWPFVRKVLKAAALKKGLPPAAVAETLDAMEAYYKSAFAPITEDTLAGNLSNTIAGRICNFLDLHGGGYTVDGACSSSLIAVATAATALSNSTIDLAVAGGVDISLDTFELIGFAKTGALTREDMKVYDRGASGFIPGEGAGFVVLKRLHDARTHGNYIYAVLRGWGISSDGKGGITAPKAQAQALAIRRAYGKAGYGLVDVDFIEGHGTGTAAGDRAELEGIALAMGEEQGRGPFRYCGITSLKSLIGHTKAASGIGGFIKAVMAVNRRVVPPTAGCREPNEAFREKARWLYPVMQGELRDKDGTLRAGVSGMGFGGINCHVTVESAGPAAGHIAPSVGERELIASYQGTELFVMSAKSQRDMTRRIADVKGLAGGISIGEMTDLSMRLATDVKTYEHFRAAIVAGSPEDLLDCLNEAEGMLGAKEVSAGEVISTARQNIWIGNSASRARVGFLFPGQGSQQLNMARPLVERYPWAREFIDRADAWLAAAGHEKVSGYVYRPLDRALDDRQTDEWKTMLSRSEIAQPAVCMASLLWTRHLARLGIRPVAVGGHSLGELTAFHAAGAYDEETLLKLAAFRGRVTSAADGSAGKMASLACGRDRVEEFLRGAGGYVVVANINGPLQTVISGETATVDRAVEAASRAGIKARHLPVSNAFHSRFMEEAADRLLREAPIPEALASRTLKLFTSMDGSEVAEGTLLKKHFSRHVTHQVDFISLVDNMTKACDILVEVGPGRVLSDLVRSIAASDGGGCFPVESRAGNDLSLNVLLGSYFVRGGDVNWPVLFENRLVRPFVAASKRLFIDNPCERPLAAEAGDIAQSSPAAHPPTFMPCGEPEDSGLFSRQQIDLIRRLILTEMKSNRIEVNSVGPETSNEKDAGGPAREAPQAEAPPLPQHGNSRPSDGRPAAPEALLNLASEITGFPTGSISLAHRLLDDLNLDSIKAGQFVARAMKLYGAQGSQLDPTSMANSSIQEIYDRIQLHTGPPESPASRTGDGPPRKLPAQEADDRIRDLRVAYVERERPSSFSFDEILEAASAEKRRFLIVSDSRDGGIGAEMKNMMSLRGVEATSIDYKRLSGSLPDEYWGYDYFVFLLPRIEGRELLNGLEAYHMAARMKSIGTVITSLKTKDPKPAYAVVQFGTGDFFKTGSRFSLQSKGSIAFLCGLHLENPDEKIRVLEFHESADAAGVIGEIAAELHAGERFSIAAFDGRFMRSVPVLEPIDERTFTERKIRWTSEDVVLVTGGARGITSECALAFARKTGVKLALAGSTVRIEKDEEIQRALRRYGENGIVHRYYACDITDKQGVMELGKRVEMELGPITGVIHGAALNRPRRAEKVSLEEAITEIAPKLLGAINICSCLKANPPKLFVAFGSVIGITGMSGNAWYGFSNEVLNLLLQQFRAHAGATEVATLAFSVWDEVGMGARMGSLSFLSSMGVLPIPKDKGVEHFLRLVEMDPAEAQVAISGRLGDLDTLQMASPPKWKGARFLEDVLLYERGVEIEARALLTLDRDPYLGDHIFKGTYLFPAVFGLEAMAEAASAAAGIEDLDYVRLENVRLSYPITVEPDGATEIRIRASVEDASAEGGGVRVKAGIASENTGFSRDHFEAIFVLGAQKPMERYPGEVPGALLDIEPREDLYGHMLFQGKRFQRIKAVRSLDDTRCVFDAEMEGDGRDSALPAEGFATKDPFFRDTLLQSVQIVVPDVVALPVEIEKWEMFLKGPERGTCNVATKLLQRGKETILADVAAVDSKGMVIERLQGYKTKIIEKVPDAPRPGDLKDPDEYDETRINLKVQSLCEGLETLSPAISVTHRSGLHEMSKASRHDLEAELFQKAYRKLQAGNGGLPAEATLEWTESGKPLVKGAEEVAVSFSHDERVCMAVVGRVGQGCDIEPLTHRSTEQWRELLGMAKVPLLERLASIDNSADRAGSRLWCAVEALRKAAGMKDNGLEYDTHIGDCVVFRGGGLSVLTFPVRLLRGPERMLAVVAAKRMHDHDLYKAGGKGSNGDDPGLEYFVPGGPAGQRVFACRFPLVLTDSAAVGGGVHFASYFRWLGEARERALKPIGRLIAEEFYNGHFMVTNSTRTEILGHVRNHETIAARTWVDKVFGAGDSSLLLRFEWRKFMADGAERPVALSRQQVSWIKTAGHGVVEPVPCPAFFMDFLRENGLLPDNKRAGAADPLSDERSTLAARLGITLYEGNVLGNGDLLKEGVFDTATEHSNLAQNIYFSNYFIWQGHLRDRYLFEISPEQYRKMGAQGQMVCMDCQVTHLREAMPFDRIAVTMKLQKLCERGLSLFFEYFKVDSGGKRQKLAYGSHTLAWVRVDGSDSYVPQDLPEIYLRQLLKRA